MNQNEAKQIASALALAAFAVAIVAGLAAAVPTATILTRAIAAMIAGNLFGWLVGIVVERIMADHAASYARANPVVVTASPAFAAGSGDGNSERLVDGKK